MAGYGVQAVLCPTMVACTCDTILPPCLQKEQEQEKAPSVADAIAEEFKQRLVE